MWNSILKHFKATNKDSDTTKCFRVLILGPANAGKTTLLKRLMDSPAGTAIVTRNRKCIKEVPRGYDQVRAILSKARYRIHNIDNEITYASNSDFEVEAVWEFIQKHSLAPPLQQLHIVTGPLDSCSQAFSPNLQHQYLLLGSSPSWMEEK
ncbi:hypothetical protein BS47DRAFT_1356843 [Hydnum rufescens UP504]|uniref:G domain-containing protein n=1 Tax=Hydnum rufescens UP504 TaxID=1448309 RepID=A0A9P6AD27_9AGAM|nr:hypothetical protein BS47DRAFT_1356843 [Hydnum rufescens UP504]